MNLTGLIKTLNSSTPNTPGCLLPVDRTGISNSQNSESFDSHLSRALDKDYTNRETSSFDTPALENRTNDYNEKSSIKDDEKKSDSAAEHDKINHHDKDSSVKPEKDASSFQAELQDKSHFHKMQTNKSSESKIIDESLKLASSINALLQKSQSKKNFSGIEDKREFSLLKNKISDFNQRIKSEISKQESDSSINASLSGKTKKVLSFIQKMDELFSRASNVQNLRSSKISDLNESLNNAIKQAVHGQKGRTEKAHEINTSINNVKVSNDISSKEPVKLFTADQLPLQTIQTKDSSDNNPSSFLKQFGTTLTDVSGNSKTSSVVTSHIPFADKLDEIISNAKISVRDGKNAQLSISLNPEHLGRMNVSFGLEDGVLNAKFLVDSQEAKESLLSNMPFLQDVLSSEGITVGSFQVDVRGEKGFFADKDGSNNFSSHSAHKESVEAETEYIARPASTHRGVIDLMV
jgi:flagellar hook-length control protein FliK